MGRLVAGRQPQQGQIPGQSAHSTTFTEHVVLSRLLAAGRQGSGTPDHAGRTSETGFAVSRFDAKKPPAAPPSTFSKCARTYATGSGRPRLARIQERLSHSISPKGRSLTITGVHDSCGI